MGKWKSREDRERKKFRKMGLSPKLEKVIERIAELERKGEPEGIVLGGALRLYYQQRGFTCPLCEEWKGQEVFGSINIGVCPLPDGETRLYGYFLCVDCSERFKNPTENEERLICKQIEGFFGRVELKAFLRERD